MDSRRDIFSQGRSKSLLKAIRDKEVSRPTDKICGMLSILEDTYRNAITVDYSQLYQHEFWQTYLQSYQACAPTGTRFHHSGPICPGHQVKTHWMLAMVSGLGDLTRVSLTPHKPSVKRSSYRSVRLSSRLGPFLYHSWPVHLSGRGISVSI